MGGVGRREGHPRHYDRSLRNTSGGLEEEEIKVIVSEVGNLVFPLLNMLSLILNCILCFGSTFLYGDIICDRIRLPASHVSTAYICAGIIYIEGEKSYFHSPVAAIAICCGNSVSEHTVEKRAKRRTTNFNIIFVSFSSMEYRSLAR